MEIIRFAISPDGTVKDALGRLLFKSSIESQQDAREAVHEAIKERKLEIDEEWEMDDDSIEITVKVKEEING
tara:strand:+ start:3759 stop:3974 length:216 start_codon:yes stop_codon:yes gene_type:complete